MSNISVVIVEDEIRNQKLLLSIIKKHCPGVEVVGMAEGVKDAVESIKLHRPTIVLLDIQLLDGTGFHVLDQLHEDERPRIIFTTAYDQHAIEAFKYSAVNYLLKPIDKDELKNSIERASALEKEDQLTSIQLLMDKMINKKDEKMISISSLKTTEYIKVSDIIHIEAMGAYSKIHLLNGTSRTVSKVIKIYDQMLSDHYFFRVHQSHLINLHMVKTLNKGDQTVLLNNGSEIAIARNRKEDFSNAMESLIL